MYMHIYIYKCILKMKYDLNDKLIAIIVHGFLAVF